MVLVRFSIILLGILTIKHSYVKQVLPDPQLEAVKGENVLTMYLNRRFNQVLYLDLN